MVTKYQWVHMADHPFANNSGFIRGHKAVWEQYHKATLLPWASVHHKNGIKSDNRIENLEGMTKSQHNSIHRHRLGTRHKVNILIECACGCGQIRSKYYVNPKTGQFEGIRCYINGHNRRGVQNS